MEIRKRINLIVSVFLLTVSVQSVAQIKLINETCLTDNNFDDRYASYSSNGERIVFESNRDGNWEIYVMDASGKHQQRITTNTNEDRSPTWHPDGKKILFESDRSGKTELYTINLKNKKICKISPDHPGQPVFGSFSPDGKYIAVSLKESENKSNIFLLNKKGRITRQLTNKDKRTYYPRWSKNRKEIVYFSRKDTDNQIDEIYKLNIISGEEARLTNWPKNNFCPSWSPDGNRIAYVTSMEGSRPEIYIMDSDGRNQTRITENDDGETLPNWHPEGNKLLITAYRNGNYEICEIDLEMND